MTMFFSATRMNIYSSSCFTSIVVGDHKTHDRITASVFVVFQLFVYRDIFSITNTPQSTVSVFVSQWPAMFIQQPQSKQQYPSRKSSETV